MSRRDKLPIEEPALPARAALSGRGVRMAVSVDDRVHFRTLPVQEENHR